MKRILAAALLAGISFQPAFAADAAPSGKSITFKTAEGVEAGTARLTESPHGVLIHLDLHDITPGEHAFHIHENGTCDPATKFESAGGHFNPDKDEHGYQAAKGPHDGDMPNLVVPENGKIQANIFNEEVEMKDLLADNGTALIVHAGADDYKSQPSGNAGDRFACAEIK
jgi:Cu-Zn family superoxide dismutase